MVLKNINSQMEEIMTNIKLTTTQETVLKAAADRPDGSIHPLPGKLKGGSALKVITALEKKGLIKDTAINPPYKTWLISNDGYRAIGQEPPKETPETEDQPATETKPARRQRTGTKQAKVIEMLKRPQGATVEQIAEAMEWQNHTVRGFFAGTLKKKLGLELTRKKTENPDRAGSVTVYHLAD